ncbi:thymidylate synthase [Neolewinella lacunae]|uniref:Thymidylate synthase n=1 Tax=Neolewinella lacunae TaxID=1517758 RepID=A0A923T9T6_9BACT|nr:thymidylate synthase [Neolewinella lacunae]MBC6995876.1 thymidylate synthase [Neolewinella lacunae]MDN3636431.1 thymidylate synthase [Neolewinella lacunae]
MELITSGINSFLIGTIKLILEKGRERVTGGSTCYELPEPILIKMTNPRSRVITIKERDWNPYLPYVESLWIATGSNEIEFPTYYVKKLGEFSDDGKYMRAGYGPRIRFYDGNSFDYKIDNLYTPSKGFVDQLKFVVLELTRDKFSRRAVITIGDPNKDCFDISGNIKQTKDFPCTRLLHFQVQTDNTLDLMTTMRSNDLVWGASAVNVFNFTLMQEYVAAILGLDIGSYYHFVSNMHIYARHLDLAKKIALVKSYDEDTSYIEYTYPTSWEAFTSQLDNLARAEQSVRQTKEAKPSISAYTFFDDWYQALATYHTGDTSRILNPHLKKALDTKLPAF